MHLRNLIIYMNLFCLTTAICLFIYLFIEPGFLYSELRRQKKKIIFLIFFFALLLGVVYGKLLGISRQTLKSDIINLLEGCNLTPDDLKVNYTRNYMPFAMYLLLLLYLICFLAGILFRNFDA